MDLRQLAALVAVAEAGSFSGAARLLHTVQSNVSTHVARLERELGATLVDRTTGSLTDEGEAVVARARRIRHEMDALRSDVDALLHDVSGKVRLGCIGTVGRWLVPRLLSLLWERHPKVEIVVVDATTTSLLPQLRSATLDLAVVNLPLADPDVASEALFDEARIVVAPDHHPLAERTSVTVAELADHALLLEPQGTAFRDELDQQAGRIGVKLKPLAEVDGLRLVASLAFEGFGAAVLPSTAVPNWLPGAWRRVAVDDLAPRRVGLAHSRRGRLSAPARVVYEAVREIVAKADQDGVRPLFPTSS
ncbi:MAG TPA: LysR family transcriptional regulator [Acidimicrobiales bacterium]